MKFRNHAIVAADILNDRVITFYEYNNHRPHTGKNCNCKTPMQTFKEALLLAKEKMIGFEKKIA